MALLAFALVGMVFTWSLEMSYGTPYLLELGLSKSRTSLVWIMGPLSGLFVQPIVGAVADKSTSRFGRRRPFMMGAAVAIGLALLTLGWASEVAGLFISDETTRATLTLGLAVMCIYTVDFCINILQATSRALIVDSLPEEKQQHGAAWDARMGASAHVTAYFIGALDLVSIFPAWLGGSTQFKKMTIIATSTLWISVSITCYAVSEKVLLPSESDYKEASLRVIVRTLWRRLRGLPARMQAICNVQFWSWVGWFPFLFYSSTWVGETYYRYEYVATSGDEDVLANVGRLGSTALVLYSFVTLACSITLPNLVRQTITEPVAAQSYIKPAGKTRSLFGISADAMLERLNELCPRLVTAWMYSELFFATVMICAPFVRSLTFATVIVALAGIPWTFTVWAPLAEMGVEINRLAADGSTTRRASMSSQYFPVRPSLEEEDEEEMEDSRDFEQEGQAHRTGESSRGDGDPESGSASGKLSGAYLGVLNVYTTIPQFVGAAMSWVVFSILEPSRNAAKENDAVGKPKWLEAGKNAPNAIAICLAIGAVSAAVAAEMARRLRKIS